MSSNTSRSSSPTPLKSKKKLDLTPKSNAQNPNSLSTSTPDKPSQPLRRSRRGFAFSIKEVRESAQSLREPREDQIDSPKDEIKTARKQILSSPDGKSVGKLKKDGDGGSIKLPEKYEVLGEFFDSLDSSIRLSRLKGSMPTFTNICPKIESLTDRRFNYSHLAQLKFIFPEAIELKKVLVFDEKTSCMKPDVHITVNVDALEVDQKLKFQSKNIHLRKVFRARLLDFYKGHPEGDDVPEEELPVPFRHSNPKFSSDMTKLVNQTLPVETPVDASMDQKQVVASHLSHSFRRRFSQKNSIPEVENSRQKLPYVHLPPRSLPVPELGNTCSKVVNVDSSKPVTNDRNLELEACPFSPSRLYATPRKQLNSINSEDSAPFDNITAQTTPARLVSTPAKFMSVTPALPPQKRCFMSPDDSEPTSSSEKLIRRGPRTSLKFDTPKKIASVESEAKGMGRSLFNDDILDILPTNLVQSIREKELKIQEEQDPAISQAKRRKQMIESLPKLFNMIHFLFQSINRSVITKEELVHKILSGHCDVVDRGEVEEQLKLLIELAPEWISEKSASSGDMLLCIKKTTSPETIRARLVEFK